MLHQSIQNQISNGKEEHVVSDYKKHNMPPCKIAFEVRNRSTMLYRPKLNNGKNAPLSWPILMYRWLNIVCWPLAENATWLQKLFERLCYILCHAVLLQHNDADLRYLRVNFGDLDKLLTGAPTYLVCIETQLRIFQLGLLKTKFREILQTFYAKIYIEESSHPKIYRRIQRQLLPTKTYSLFYLMTVLVYFLIPIMNIIYQRKDLLYKMIPPFDPTPTHIYFLQMMARVWYGNIGGSLVFGEANILAESVLHLNYRYRLLREDLERNTKILLERANSKSIARDFQREIVKILQRNVELNEFAMEVQNFYSFHIFVLFSFAAVTLCVLSFKVYTNVAESTAFVFWMFAKVSELLATGFVGSTLIATTDGLSSMYYYSNWEHCIMLSTNTHENVKLMKLLVMAIEMNQKPFQLSGLNFFSISLTAVLKILQGAASYFTCLISFR